MVLVETLPDSRAHHPQPPPGTTATATPTTTEAAAAAAASAATARGAARAAAAAAGARSGRRGLKGECAPAVLRRARRPTRFLKVAHTRRAPPPRILPGLRRAPAPAGAPSLPAPAGGAARRCPPARKPTARAPTPPATACAQARGRRRRVGEPSGGRRGVGVSRRRARHPSSVERTQAGAPPRCRRGPAPAAHALWAASPGRRWRSQRLAP